MGMDHIGPLLGDDLPQDAPGPVHCRRATLMEGSRIVADASRLRLWDIDAPVGDDYNIVAPVLQLLGQLYDMGFRPADIQAHGGH